MGRRKGKPRLIPEQDQRICRVICLCQLTMVLSLVAIIYLYTVVYKPSFQALKSGFELDPVMCQTVDLQMPNNCLKNWASCGEWCMSRSSDICHQISSVVRRNGTNIQLNNCSRIRNTTCAMIDMSRLNKFNCNNGTVCNNIQGVFNCTNGHCKNMSEFFLCHHKADGPIINSAKDNTKLNGFFECHGVHCTKIRRPFSCDRRCAPITTMKLNVLLMHEDTVTAAGCENGVAFNEARGIEKGVQIDAVEFWKEEDGILLTNCATVESEGEKIIATDCLNGTLLEHDALPNKFMNFTQFWSIYENSTRSVDPEQKFVPNQQNLTIYSWKKLFINVDGCVNTLRGECKEFVARYGSDGDNNTAQSRYQCYWNKDPNVDHVLARYDLDKVYRELVVSLIVPIVLFVLSSISLCIITKSVKVGDDAKMRCVCTGSDSDIEDMYRTNKRKKKNEKIKVCDDFPQEAIEDHDEAHGDTHEMIGSTKSLIPLSPVSGSETTDKTFDEEKASNCDGPEKPLVII